MKSNRPFRAWRNRRDRSAAALLAVVLTALVLGAAAPAWAAGAAWMTDGKDWPVRRLVTVDAKRTPGAAGEEIAVVDMATDTLAADDGHDIRVANSAGRPVPFRVLQVGPGSFARVAFEARPGRNIYAIYYGNPKAPSPGKELILPVSRGLLMETRTFAGGNIQNERGTENAFDRANIVQGSDFVENVFHGHNPFGPTGRTISRYDGWLRVPMDGDYGFATSSDDASFLKIDGQLVVGWGGYHGWVGDARHNKTVHLTAGPHRFEYYHVNMGTSGGAVAAWKPPGADKWLPIPPTAFLPVHRATLDAREKFGTPLAGEMTFANVGEAVIGDEDYIQRYHFTSRPSGFDARRAIFTWDFGDGTQSAGVGQSTVEHIFLLDGPATVSVSVTDGKQTETVRNVVTISRNWDTVTRPKIDPTPRYAKLVSEYDLGAMPPAQAARAMELFKRVDATPQYLAAGHALATRCQPVDDKVLTDNMDNYAAALLADDPEKGPAAAVGEYLAAAERARGPFAKAQMYNGAGRILLDRLNNDPKAEQMFAASLRFRDRGNHPAIRDALIGAGDVQRRRGNGEKADEFYRAAEKTGQSPPPNVAAVRVGSLSRSIEFYVRTKDYETAEKLLREWDSEFPTHKLNGYSTLLWVRFYQAQGRHREAVREAGDLVAGNARSNYAPELLIAAADSHLELKDPARARQLLEHVISVYPTSPLVADAKKKLEQLSQK